MNYLIRIKCVVCGELFNVEPLKWKVRYCENCKDKQ